MKIYIDVTNLLRVDFLTGIQRVVREVVLRMIRNRKLDIVLLNYHDGYKEFQIIDAQKFMDYFSNGIGSKDELVTDQRMNPVNMQPGTVFFDIDGVWSLSLKRSHLLPILKANGVKLVVYVYDIIPITHPQFCHEQTVYNFMTYIGAYLQCADLIIASAQSTLDEIDKLLEQLNLPKIPGKVSWLGSDFNIKNSDDTEINPEAVDAVAAGRYVLMVGTIEPRKNHELVLEAFEHALFERGINLIFAGRIGWNVQAFEKKIEEHPKRNRQLFHLSGMNDATIDYLYRNAFCVAFPTFNEGFGLPIIEAFQRGTPVLASDIPILREVGGELCDYFDPNSWESFADTCMSWVENAERYEEVKRKVAKYQPVSWDTVTEKIENALETMKVEYPYPIPEKIKQMVYLTARSEDLLETLPYMEAFMPFIEELVICCPDSMVEIMKKEYHGRFRLQYLTDSQVLNGAELPEDHSKRNFFLRCLAMKSDLIDDVFIMADDDYRPLHLIDQDVFIKNGKFCGYYCYHLQNWKGDQNHYSSFDHCMFRTRQFLQEQGYSTWMYESHMPQAIDKRVYQEILEKHPDIETKGYSEWSIFFNYVNTIYPGQVENLPFVAMSWPGNCGAWDLEVFPKEYIFENYYRELYEPGEIFEQYSKDYYAGTEMENRKKVTDYMNYHNAHSQIRAMFQAYRANYEMIYGEYPTFALSFTAEGCTIRLPQYIGIGEEAFTRIPFLIQNEIGLEEAEITYRYIDVQGNEIVTGADMNMALDQKELEIPVRGIWGGMKGIFELEVRYRGQIFSRRTKLCIMKKGLEA